MRKAPAPDLPNKFHSTPKGKKGYDRKKQKQEDRMMMKQLNKIYKDWLRGKEKDQ